MPEKSSELLTFLKSKHTTIYLFGFFTTISIIPTEQNYS